MQLSWLLIPCKCNGKIITLTYTEQQIVVDEIPVIWKILFVKIVLVSILVIVALFSAPILNSTEYTHFKHALEWNYFLGVVTFYLLTFMFWKKNKPSVHTP